MGGGGGGLTCAGRLSHQEMAVLGWPADMPSGHGVPLLGG